MGSKPTAYTALGSRCLATLSFSISYVFLPLNSNSTPNKQIAPKEKVAHPFPFLTLWVALC
jgi:hypothetical protein